MATTNKNSDSTSASEPATRSRSKRTPVAKSRTAPSVPGLPIPARPYLVGIGASAGGLEALSSLIAALPVDLGLAYVVIQHLSPTHRSMMVQLLGRETAMAVMEITDGTVPEPNVIYVTPASHNVVMREGRLVLFDAPREVMPRPSVNTFFTSLATEKGEDAIGVILSGTGSDGASGLREIKASGGFTFAQDPNNAKYSGMPQAAIDTGCVDWVLPADAIAREIAQIAHSHGVVTIAVQPQTAATSLKKLLMRVKQHTRIDFGGYKEGTLWRRIERRMAARHAASLDDYLALVDTDPDELDRLSKDILISVTAFFRDPEAFAALKEALRGLVAPKQPGDEIRIWVAACATGEEAYSIAMLLAEILGPSIVHFRIQIFATDIDMGALAVARRGSYSEGALSDLDPSLISRHFIKSGSRYEVSRTLRDMVVIARQDMVLDPPFLRLDLVSCRNVLIYFQNELQAKVLATFQYGLRPGGYLFLGKSEGIFQQEALFEAADKSVRLFRRRAGEARIIPPIFRLPDGHESATATPKKTDAEHRLLDSLVGHYVPTSILINSAFDIQHIYGDASAYLSVPSGKPCHNLQLMLHREFRADLQLLVHHAERKLDSAYGRPHVLKTGNGKKRLRLAVHPMERGVASSFCLVCFEELPEAKTGKSPLHALESPDDVRDAKALEEELITTRERLQTVIEELETSNEEMQALNEEVQAANEELQSSNEELETTNEELQSTNEELTTVNEELQVRSVELAETMNDLEKVQNSVGFPILVCNHLLELTRFNSPAAAIFSLSDKSLGQVLPAMRLPLGMQDFSARVFEAITTNKPAEESVFSSERHYLLRVSPYETTQPGTRGAVITLIDHTDRLSQERAIRESRETLLAIMNNSTSIITLKDLAGRYEFANAQFEKTFGLFAEDVIGKTDAQIFSPKVADDFRSKELEVVRLQKPVESEDRLFYTEGDRYLLSIRFPLFGVDGVVHSICTQSSDITERKHAEEQLRLAARVFDRAGEGIVITDAEQRILTINGAFTEVTGYSAEEVLGKTPSLLSSDRHKQDFYLEMWSTLNEQGWWQGEIWNRRKNGETYPEWLTINSVHDADKNVINYVGIFSDITVVKESQRRVEFLATHDELTTLPNRSLFIDRIRQSTARARRHNTTFAVFFVDLDNFKVVNDSLGHQAGDELLKEVALRLRECMRAADTVARFGGDEFALMIEDATPEEADMTARRIADALTRPMSLGGQSVYVSASIGISLFPVDGEDAETLLKHADGAMYQAKESGKRTHQFFTNDLKKAADERLQLENGLRRAIERNELFLVYQPQIDIASGTLVGVEALVRWQHPEHGLVPPLKFIPLAEKTGLIDHVGEWVADAACRQVASWQTQGYSVPRVSINVSPEQLRRSHVPNSMRRLLDHYDLRAEQITIELTEGALMADPDQAQRLLRELKALGVSLSIDDFGTGYSSLSYLRRYPLDELKIDRAFVNEIASNPDDRAIAQTIIAMSRTLGLTVVAEGIETQEQLDALRSLGCQTGQGYFFAKPLTADEVVARFLPVREVLQADFTQSCLQN
ncbi:MAG: EAL domain-containing protein [Bacteroidota bacterium]